MSARQMRGRRAAVDPPFARRIGDLRLLRDRLNGAANQLVMMFEHAPNVSCGHSLHFGSVSMSGLPPITTEWRAFENSRNVPVSDLAGSMEDVQWSCSSAG
jgi:hypothetical protein